MPNYVGMPEAMHLSNFGRVVEWAFGEHAYLVGSATAKKEGWRDVDIRIILSDEDYAAWDIGEPRDMSSNPKWMSLCMAYSALGAKMTGLRIDFQIQQRTTANLKYKDGERIPIGMFPFDNVQNGH